MHMRKLLKKRIHPLLGYAFVMSAGILGINRTAVLIDDEPLTPPLPVVETAVARQKSVPPDFPTLKEAARLFSAQLAETKTQALSAQSEGRRPPPELFDAIGQGEQLCAMIEASQSGENLNGTDAVGQMLAIAKRISDNSKF